VQLQKEGLFPCTEIIHDFGRFRRFRYLHCSVPG
jgi:hypothetical protein